MEIKNSQGQIIFQCDGNFRKANLDDIDLSGAMLEDVILKASSGAVQISVKRILKRLISIGPSSLPSNLNCRFQFNCVAGRGKRAGARSRDLQSASDRPYCERPRQLGQRGKRFLEPLESR